MKVVHILIVLIFIFNTNAIVSQIDVQSRSVAIYQSLSEYKKENGNTLLAKDSVNIKIIENDTLIEIRNFEIPVGKKVPYEFKDDSFLENYKKIAFNHSNGNYSSKTEMKYWKSEIKIFFSNHVDTILKNEFIQYTADLSKDIDSLTITEVPTIEMSNYIVYTEKNQNYETNISEQLEHNDFYIYWNGNNQIYKGAIKLITTKSKTQNLFDLKRLFTLTLGYFNTPSDFPLNSYFSKAGKAKELSPTDKEYLKYHYSYGICKGTALEDFEKSHSKAKKSLKENPNNLYYFLHPYR